MRTEVKKFITEYIEKNKKEYHKAAMEIWERPELGLEEYEACRIYTEFLKAKGFDVETGVAGMPTSYVATYGNGSPVIGFSAEYDALPGLSQKVLDHKEPVKMGGPGHGCGHNLLGIGGILAAASLKEAMERYCLKGMIKLFGTPAEELCIGKPFMGNAGVFHGVDVFFDWHPFQENSANYVTCPSYFNVRYHFNGRTAHGNSPWHGRSALDAAILQGHAIELLREHIPPSTESDSAHTINYTFSNTGPEFPSVVPDRATLWCVGRFTTYEQAKNAMERIDKCAEGAALATGVTVEKEYITASHEMIPNKVVSQIVHNNLTEFGGVVFTDEEKAFVMNMQKEEGQEPYWEDDIKPLSAGSMAVTDSAEYSWVAPYALLSLYLGVGPGWHNWMVTACSGRSHGEKTIAKAGQILACSAVDILADKCLLEDAKKEWQKRIAGREYKSLLPGDIPVPLGINKAVMEKYR